MNYLSLQDFFKANNKVALCFSGGVDSSYLLYAGLHYGAQIQPYYLKTPFQPEFELFDAKKLAQQLGVQLIIVEGDPLDNPLIVQNDALRCYYCKNTGLGKLNEIAKSQGYTVVIDGTNFDDDPANRPGMKALDEMGIVSPLRLAQLTKKEIRQLSKEAGLFTWDKPAYACLATRIPEGSPLFLEDLQKIEHSEQALFDLGFTDFRVRVFFGAARIQLPLEQFQMALDKREEILARVSFENVLMDLYPRV